MLSGMGKERSASRVLIASWAITAGVLLLTACSAPAQVEGPVMPARGIQTLQSVVETVLADASKQTGLDRESLEVLSAVSVTWPDGSLGCPKPGVMYTQALVPGYRVQIRAGERVLDYHASQRGYFVLCPAGISTAPVEGVDTR